jgi:hypothetical protein
MELTPVICKDRRSFFSCTYKCLIPQLPMLHNLTNAQGMGDVYPLAAEGSQPMFG